MLKLPMGLFDHRGADFYPDGCGTVIRAWTPGGTFC